MAKVLYGLAGAAMVFVATQIVASGAEVRIGFSVLSAAILVVGGAVVAAIDRARPKPVSKDNGGKRES